MTCSPPHFGFVTYYVCWIQLHTRRGTDSVQSLSPVRLFGTPWITARQASCPSPTPRVHPNPGPSSRWCHPAISSSVVPFSSPQSFPASGSFQMSQLFALGGQSIGVSAHRLKKSKNCESNYNYNYQQKDKHKDLKQDIKITKYGGGE